MLRELSVKQILTMSAALRLDKSTTEQERKEVVNGVINLLDLYDVRHSPIGKKRNQNINEHKRQTTNMN